MADKITALTTAKASELAVVLGVTSRRVHQLHEEGVIVADERNCYNLCDSVQAYIKLLKNRMPDEDYTKLEKAKRTAEATLKASKAQVAKLEADELKGKMHRSEDVEAMTMELVQTIRGSLTALPGRLAVDVVGLETAAEASVVIRKEVDKIMEELAQFRYDPAKYAELVRQRMQWDSAGGDTDGD